MTSLLAAGWFAAPAHAGLIVYGDRAAWMAAVGSSTQVNIAGQVGEFDVLMAGAPIVLPSGGNLAFDQDLEGLQVPDSWATWAGGATPRVLYSGVDVTSVSGTFSAPMMAFGLEFQPDPFWPIQMQLALNGVTVFDGPVGGEGGAQFLGWVITDSDPGVTVLTLTGEAEFAFGRMLEPGKPGVPEAGHTLSYLLGTVLGLLGWARCARRAAK